ncbi:hypothetical protein ACET3Z_014195 [Daucus carota]
MFLPVLCYAARVLELLAALTEDLLELCEHNVGALWKQAGIYEAIMASTYRILKDKDLIYGLAESPSRRFGITEPLISSVRSMPSSDKIKERSSFAERLVSLKEDAVVNNTNHDEEAKNVNIKLANEAVVSKANYLQDKIVNIKEESSGNCTSELPHLELMARNFRLEAIVDAVKAAKLDASSVDIETVVLDRT